MKKRNTLGLCILLLAMLTACGQEKNMEQATKKDPASGSVSVPAGTVYDDLIRRYRELAADPDAFRDADGAGEQNFLMLARGIGSEWGEDPANIMGYAIRDFNGDGVPEHADLTMTPFVTAVGK